MTAGPTGSQTSNRPLLRLLRIHTSSTMIRSRLTSNANAWFAFSPTCARAYSTVKPAARKRTITDRLPQGMPGITVSRANVEWNTRVEG
jgi:hypothetical protein